MRRIRPLLVAGTLVLAVGIGTTVALTTRQAPTATAASPAGQPAVSPAAASDPTTSPTPTTPPPPRKPDSSGEAAKAVATARAFLARELGMTEMVAGPFRSTDARSRRGRLPPQVRRGPPAAASDRPLCGRGPAPAPARRLVGPGRARPQHPDHQPHPAAADQLPADRPRHGADVYEGTLYFKVTQDRPGRDLLLGQGFVDGSASTQPGDLGTLRFRQPAGTAPGWVIFYDASADGSNGIIQATMVRVQFAAATPAPRILEVTTSPRLRTLDGGFWLELPQGEGKVVFSVKATDTQRVRFTLTPTGTEVADHTELLGEDRTPADGFTLVWRYPAEGLSAHLGIEAIGPGGTADKMFGIAH